MPKTSIATSKYKIVVLVIRFISRTEFIAQSINGFDVIRPFFRGDLFRKILNMLIDKVERIQVHIIAPEVFGDGLFGQHPVLLAMNNSNSYSLTVSTSSLPSTCTHHGIGIHLYFLEFEDLMPWNFAV